MAGIMNRTARQFNVKCLVDKKRRVVVRIAPGFNIVDDDHWNMCKNDPYILELHREGHISFGESEDKLAKIQSGDTVSKSKVENIPPKIGASNSGVGMARVVIGGIEVEVNESGAKIVETMRDVMDSQEEHMVEMTEQMVEMANAIDALKEKMAAAESARVDMVASNKPVDSNAEESAKADKPVKSGSSKSK